MPNLSTIEKELQTVTKVKPVPATKGDEARQTYLRKVVETVETLSDDAWNALAPAAQLWVNTAMTAYKAKTPLPEFPEEESAPRATLPKKPATVHPAAPANGSSAAAEPEAVSESSTKRGAQAEIKKMLMADMSLSTSDIQEKLTEAGYRTSALTISTIRSDFRHSIKMLKDAGKLRGITI